MLEVIEVIAPCPLAHAASRYMDAGAMISANSLVISDVPPGAFAVGVPAKAIRWSKPSNDTVAEAPTGAHAQGSVGSKDN